MHAVPPRSPPPSSANPVSPFQHAVDAMSDTGSCADLRRIFLEADETATHDHRSLRPVQAKNVRRKMQEKAGSESRTESRGLQVTSRSLRSPRNRTSGATSPQMSV